MSAEQRLTYVDSSATVKLVVAEPESKPLRRYLSRRQPLVSSALARIEVAPTLIPCGREAVTRSEDVLRRIQLLRIAPGRGATRIPPTRSTSCRPWTGSRSPGSRPTHGRVRWLRVGDEFAIPVGAELASRRPRN
jgi:hypothetical protein